MTLIGLTFAGSGLVKLFSLFALLVGVSLATKGLVGPSALRSYTAGADAMGKGLAVVRGTDDETVVIAGANVAVLGFVDEANISAGNRIGIIEGGEFIAQIGAAVTAGDFLVTDSSGRLIPTSAAGDNVVAQALSSGSNANDFIVAKFCQFVRGANSPVAYYTASGAIPLSSGTVALDGAGALTMTLATPTTPGQDGTTITITATTAQAHTVQTAANKIQSANATYDKVTFAHLGDTVVLEAVKGLLLVKYLNGATLSEV